MLRWACVGIVALALSATGHAVDIEREISGYQRTHALHSCTANQKVKVMAIGLGKRGFAGLYVYDADGNCVSWDDTVHPTVQDDLALEFVADQAGKYLIEVRNMGQASNKLTIRIQ